MITIEALTKSSNIRHGFFTRDGGVSNGLYASLNCGYGSSDDRNNVVENRHRVIAELNMPSANLVTCHQEHTANAIAVEQAWALAEAPVADGMATNTPGLILGILTADCTPVLFADDRANIVGAAHAGWRGAFTGVLEATLDCMVSLGASLENISAGIGPSIGPQSYEIGPEFFERFVDAGSKNSQFFTPSDRENHHMFDLPSYVAAKLASTGIADINRLDHDTCTEEDVFYSYRRSVHNAEADYGRQISVIGLAS